MVGLQVVETYCKETKKISYDLTKDIDEREDLKLLQLGGVTKCITIVYGIKISIDPRNTKGANPWANLHIRLCLIVNAPLHKC
jgi:hypothetical protein